jgi:hypothetical protein
MIFLNIGLQKLNFLNIQVNPIWNFLSHFHECIEYGHLGSIVIQMPSETNDGKVRNLEILFNNINFKGGTQRPSTPMKRERNLCDH